MASQGNRQLIDFLIAPYEMGETFASGEELALACKESVKQLVKLALEKELLPPDTLMIQFAHVSALDDGALSFDIPPAVKRDSAEALLRAGIFHAAFVKAVTGMSLFREISLKIERSMMVIFTRDARHQAVPPRDGCLARVVLRNFQDTPDNVSDIDISAVVSVQEKIHDDFVFLNGFQEAVGRYTGQTVERQGSRANAAIVHYSNEDQGSGRLDLLKNSLYQFHISPLVKQGHVVICAPRIFRQGKSVGGGCLFVIKRFPSAASLKVFYAVSYKILNLIAGYQDTAQRLSHAAGKTAAIKQAAASLGMMRHSLENSFDSLRNKVPAAAPYLQVEAVMIAASCAYGQMPFQYVEWNKISPALCAVFFPASGGITIDDTAANGKSFDPRFVGILVELSRNLNKHTATGVSGSLKLLDDRGGHLAVQIAGRMTSDQAYALWGNIENTVDDDGATKLRGIPTIILLAEALALRTEPSQACWRFTPLDGRTIIEETRSLKKGYLLLTVAGPSSIFDSQATESCDIQFTLEIRGLNTTAKTTP